MNDIQFIVRGNPQPQLRHRSRKNSIHTYDPSKKKKAEFLLKARTDWSMPYPFIEPLTMKLVFYCEYLSLHHVGGNKNKPLKSPVPQHHIKTPDIDNLIKFVLDALNGYYYDDDKQIWKIEAEKRYGEKARTEITISRCEVL